MLQPPESPQMIFSYAIRPVLSSGHSAISPNIHAENPHPRNLLFRIRRVIYARPENKAWHTQGMAHWRLGSPGVFCSRPSHPPTTINLHFKPGHIPIAFACNFAKETSCIYSPASVVTHHQRKRQEAAIHPSSAPSYRKLSYAAAHRISALRIQ
jgi:hypothetical protein